MRMHCMFAVNDYSNVRHSFTNRWLRISASAVLVALVLTGCNSTKTVKLDNPVLPPAPPRDGKGTVDVDYVSYPLGNDGYASVDQLGVVQASAANSKDRDLSGNKPVAWVDGQPIFAYELLDRYGKNLSSAREKMSPARYQQLRADLIRRDLRAKIEQKILVLAMKRNLDPDRLGQLDQILNGAFESEISRLKTKLNVETVIELQQELAKEGTNLDRLREEFKQQRMAMEYLGSKLEAKRKVTRPEMISYYKEHQQDYAVPARAKWQQIMISFEEHGGYDKAGAVLNQAVSGLRKGVDFGKVAIQYSDGPTAETGGDWDWTQSGSLANKSIDHALFTLPIGEAQIFTEKDKAFQVVRVTERHDAGYIPFEDVQTKIKETLRKSQRKQKTEEVLGDVFRSADVSTIFDNQADGPYFKVEASKPL